MARAHAALWAKGVHQRTSHHAGHGDQSVAGEKVRTSTLGGALDLGNSQSDGIAANHSRKLVLDGFEQAARRNRFARSGELPREDSM